MRAGRLRLFPLLWLFPPILFCLPPARASDGVIEINQAKAIAGGVAPGDTAGFPVTLAVGGSYRLTSDLDVAVLGPTAVDIDAIEVLGGDSTTIDLNGFELHGPANCESFPCSSTGTGVGIRATNAGARLLTVRNGSIVGMGDRGLNVTGPAVRLSDLGVFGNGLGGIAMTGGVLSRAVVSGNGGLGIDAYDAVIESSYLYGNQGNEIQVTFGTIDDCTVDANGGIAIQVFQALVRGTHVKTSANVAVVCTGACALSQNIFSECNGAGCLSGAGTFLQLPPASNQCGDVVCP